MTRKRLIWILSGLGLAALLVVAFLEQPLLVDLATVRRGGLRVTVDDDGVTAVRERFTLCAPIRARLVRTHRKAGDSVRKGETLVARFAPLLSDPLDERSDATAKARLQQAESGMQEADARVKQAAADVDFADAELRRVESLPKELRSDSQLDRAKRDAIRAREARHAAEFSAEMAKFGRDLAKASRLTTGPLATQPVHDEIGKTTEDRRFELRAPVDGVVLRVFEESERTVAAGTRLLEIADLKSMEIVADFLSQDAVRVRQGMPVRITGWGGGELAGRVRLVEPSGFTRISALGVEEQRVNIRVDPEGDAKTWSALGDGYRVELSVELWRSDDVLQVPTGALFGHAQGFWKVWAVIDGCAVERQVKIGRRTGLSAEVLEGLMPGDQVIDFPSSSVTAGRLVVDRSPAK